MEENVAREEFKLPFYYENKLISVEDFVECFKRLTKLSTSKLLPKDDKIRNDLFIQEFANSIKEDTKGPTKMISLSTLDKQIFGNDKTDGILFGIGKADPFVFNEEVNLASGVGNVENESFEEESSEEEKDEDNDMTFVGMFFLIGCSYYRLLIFI